jgi:hypothetical protein
MRLRLLAGAALALSAALGAPTVAEEEHTVWRLFVADHAEPRVTVLDLETAAEVASFELAAPASLYVTASKQAVYAVQGSANRVSAIRSGIAVDDHGDHGDIEVTAPSLVEAVVEGERPVHFIEHDGHITIFFDGEGVAKVAGEQDWLKGDLETADYAAAAPHHGVAVKVGETLLISEPHPEDPGKLPVGINVLDRDGNRIGDLHSCPDLHGEASSGHTLAIACATGLLLVEEGTAGPTITHLPYAGLPEGKSTTLLGGVGLKYWLGNYGADKVVLIDPEDAAAFRLVDLPSRRVHFAVDPVNVKYAYIFTEDGALQRLNVLSGAITDTLALTEPYSMDGEWSLPRPRIAVAGHEIAVTDPLGGVVHIVDAESFELEREIAVAGRPYNIVAVGGSGQSH